MDGTKLQSRVYKGYAKSAQRVGLPFDMYRSSSSANPLSPGNKVTTLNAAFTVHSSADFNFGKPSDYKGPLFHALLDGSLVLVGDYLKNAATGAVYFIAGKDPVVPVLAVQANRIVTILNQEGGLPKPVGVSGYGGTVASTSDANQGAVMTAWPASVLEGARGVGAGLLPNDAGVGMWRILLPALTGVLIKPGFLIKDDVGKQMAVRQAELSGLGWNIQAVEQRV